MSSAKERRYNVMSSLIGWAHTHSNPCNNSQDIIQYNCPLSTEKQAFKFLKSQEITFHILSIDSHINYYIYIQDQTPMPQQHKSSMYNKLDSFTMLMDPHILDIMTVIGATSLVYWVC